VTANFYVIHLLGVDGSLWRLDITDTFSSPEMIGTGFRSIASGIRPYELCGVTIDGQLSCVEVDASNAQVVRSEHDWSAPIVMQYGGCAGRSDGSLWCWPRNDIGSACR